MFFRTSARSLEAVVREHPDWAAPLARILRVALRVPVGGLIDPLVVSEVTQIATLEAVAYLHVLKEAGLGEFIIRVLDREGIEIERYPSIAAIPARVENEFGDAMDVLPENVDMSFEPWGMRGNPNVERLIEALPA